MRSICPSILSADFLILGEEVKLVESAGADIIHCDIMDGHFVPNISYGPEIVAAVNRITDLPLDVHLMIENPEMFIEKFADAGADMISVHYENNYHLDRLISQIKSFDCKAGVVINPATPVNVLTEVLSLVDYVLVMSVNPGFGGQKFIPGSIEKVKQLRKILVDKNLKVKIQIDGGIGLENIQHVRDAGVDMFVAGASIFKASNKSQVVEEMKKIIA